VKKGGARGIKHERCFLLNEAQFDYMCRVVRGRDPLRMNQFKLDVTKAFSKRRTVEPLRREYLPGYHESRDGLKALGAQRHHYINLARAENRVAGLSDGERGSADEQQLGLLVVIQKIEQAAFNEAVHNGMSPGMLYGKSHAEWIHLRHYSAQNRYWGRKCLTQFNLPARLQFALYPYIAAVITLQGLYAKTVARAWLLSLC
jgi:hypothetical protein